MLTVEQIDKQSLPHISDLMEGYSDQEILAAHDWVVTVLADYEMLYGLDHPRLQIRKADVEYFLEQYINHYHGDQAPAEPHGSWGEPLQEVS